MALLTLPPNAKPLHVPEQHICFYHDDKFSLAWDKRDIPLFVKHWNKGTSLVDIAQIFGRDPDEAIILALDLARSGRIAPRDGGIMGHK